MVIISNFEISQKQKMHTVHNRFWLTPRQYALCAFTFCFCEKLRRAPGRLYLIYFLTFRTKPHKTDPKTSQPVLVFSRSNPVNDFINKFAVGSKFNVTAAAAKKINAQSQVAIFSLKNLATMKVSVIRYSFALKRV